MYVYNLLIKRGDLDERAAHAMVNQQLTRRFGPDVRYITTAILDNEVVVLVRYESKRGLQTILGDWFVEDEKVDEDSGWPVGSLLHYREILHTESNYNRLGG
jgi:hypothetical protein